MERAVKITLNFKEQFLIYYLLKLATQNTRKSIIGNENVAEEMIMLTDEEIEMARYLITKLEKA